MDRDTLGKSMNNKLRSDSGESIAETLVALLISALALVMLAGVISASTRIVTSSREKLDRYYDVSEAIVNEDVSAADSAANEGVENEEDRVSVSGTATITLNTVSGSTETPAGAAVTVTTYTNPVMSGKKVVSYRIKE